MSMSNANKRVTVYLKPEYHRALRVKAAETEYSVSDLVNSAVKQALRGIVGRLRSLGDEPRPHGCEKLSARERYRIRQGDYRIVYSIADAGQTVEIFKVGHRSEIYNK